MSIPQHSSLICDWCLLKGHNEDSCYARKASQQQDMQRGRRRRPRSSRIPPITSPTPSLTLQDHPSSQLLEYARNTTLQSTEPLSYLWCADSGASSHMSPHRDWFAEYKDHVIPVELADGNIIYSAGIGTVHFKPNLRGVPERTVVLHHVLHVPGLSKSLLSVVSWSVNWGWKMVLEKDTMDFYLKGVHMCSAKLHGNLLCLQGSTICHPQPASAFNITAAPLDLALWHRRFSHINYKDLKAMKSQNLVTGLDIKSSVSPDPICEPCLAGNQRRIVNKSATRHTTPLHLIHADLHGPMPVQSPEGYRYFCIFVDDATRHWCLYFLKNKSETFQVFKSFKAYMELATKHKVKILHDDKGGEFMSKAFEQFCTEAGIQRRHTMRSEPHSNGVAERAIQTISNHATSLLHESKLPPSFWSHAVKTVVHTHNRMPTSSLPNSTPHFAMYGSKPDVSLLRVFGSAAYVHIKKDKRSGFSPHMEKCIFVGYPSQYKGWEFYNPQTRKFVLSDRADFDERVCPGTTGYFPDQVVFLNPPPSPATPAIPATLEDHFVVPDVPQQVGEVPICVAAHPAPQPQLNQDVPPQPPLLPAQPPLQEQSPAPSEASSIDPGHPPPLPDPPAPPLRRSNRVRTDPNVWKNNWFKVDYEPAARQQQQAQPRLDEYRNPAPAIQLSDSDSASDDSTDSEHPAQSANQASDSCPYLTLPEALECAYVSAAKSGYPKSYSEAMTLPDADLYHEAACKEIDSLLENGTWELTTLPKGRKAIGCRWVFLIKHKSDGSVERYKARLVAQGFSQRPGFDYGETYAATVKWATLRAILAIGAFEDLEMESVDISSAFLNGDIDTEVYMKQPEGFPQGPKDKVLRLLKSIYGLKQSPRLWQQKLDSVLTQLGFKKVESDNSLWIYRKDTVCIIIPVFVDDLTLVSKDKAAINSVIEHLEKHFKLRRLGPLEFLLGVKIERDRPRHTIHLSQKQYIINMLERFGFSSCTPVSTPINPGISLTQSQCPSTPDEVQEMRTVPYISAVGSLLYLAISTRPDIAYAVSVLARFNTNPGKAHWAAVKHLFRYLKGSMDYKLSYSPDPSTSEMFVSYSDADHGGDKDTGYSTGAYVVKMGTGAVSWRSKLQEVVTLSTTEAEYIAACHAGQEMIWFHNLLEELGYNFSKPHTLHIDNMSAIAFSQNPAHHGRMKQLDLKYLWLRDQVTKFHTIFTVHCPTNLMPADLLTKPLTLHKVQSGCKLLGLTGIGGSTQVM